MPQSPNDQSERGAASASDKPDNQHRRIRGLSVKLLGACLLSICLLIAGGAFGLHLIDQQLNEAKPFGKTIYKIAKGENLRRFISQLQDSGMIDEPYSLRLYARYKGLDSRLHIGHYQFANGMDLREVLDSITTGKHRLAHQFRFVQGSNFKQLRAALRSAEGLKQTLVDKTDAEVLELFDRNNSYAHPEGLFFPETYAYHPEETDYALLNRAFQSTQKILSKLWEKRDKNIQISTPYEALILASIIEKETALASERALISGVFMNRLKKGMRLQTDPTVIYGIGDAYDGNITRKHLTTDTPYNTYTRYGLPPTPISFPGRAAIEAALKPKKTKALYFVAKGDGSGGHRFSNTLEEHNQAVKQYLKMRRRSS